MTIVQRRRTSQRVLALVSVAAATATAVGTAFAAPGPADADLRLARAQAAHHDGSPAGRGHGRPGAAPGEVVTPTFDLTAVDRQSGNLYLYFADGQGGFGPRYDVGVDYSSSAAVADVDRDKDGHGDGFWNFQKDGLLTYTWSDGHDAYTKDIGPGWQIYDKVLSPGDLGGAGDADVIGRDASGVLWLYLGYPDGELTARHRVGGGWGQYTEIAGQGDLDDDGHADIVARDRAGTLWLYRGTGDYTNPFEARTRIGGGWNTYDRILSVGDLDGDGHADLVARSSGGDLYRYSGNGNVSDPFDNAVKIGRGFDIYNLL
ncbi:FG-GAP repeat domain-containing protein [Streptomyces sp. cg36]|uniref:FG-GAP repeat domain-containing protein n=1 Tax=Streptomyces sp. cg36 TaxID=3238798 RepID=UPI0034E23C39